MRSAQGFLNGGASNALFADDCGLGRGACRRWLRRRWRRQFHSDADSDPLTAADRDGTKSTAEADIYVKTNGNTTDSISVSTNSADAGTASSPQYRYVGGGVWQHTVTSSDGAAGFADAFSYGVETAAGAVP